MGMNEIVYCIEKKDLPVKCIEREFVEPFDYYIDRFIAHTRNKWKSKKRIDIEHDLNYVQPIPYNVISCGRYIYFAKRTNKSTETRLHDFLSLGFGGHMTSKIEHIDKSTTLTYGDYYDHAFRELKEELDIDLNNITSTLFLGYLYDQSEDVSKHHFGIVFLQRIKDKDAVKILEEHNSNGLWIHTKDIDESIVNKCENWSRIVIKNIIKEVY